MKTDKWFYRVGLFVYTLVVMFVFFSVKKDASVAFGITELGLGLIIPPIFMYVVYRYFIKADSESPDAMLSNLTKLLYSSLVVICSYFLLQALGNGANPAIYIILNPLLAAFLWILFIVIYLGMRLYTDRNR